MRFFYLSQLPFFSLPAEHFIYNDCIFLMISGVFPCEWMYAVHIWANMITVRTLTEYMNTSDVALWSSALLMSVIFSVHTFEWGKRQLSYLFVKSHLLVTVTPVWWPRKREIDSFNSICCNICSWPATTQTSTLFSRCRTESFLSFTLIYAKK